jgi:hypothetical protein
MKTYRGVVIIAATFLTLALNEDEWSASCPGHFTAREIDLASFR